MKTRTVFSMWITLLVGLLATAATDVLAHERGSSYGRAAGYGHHAPYRHPRPVPAYHYGSRHAHGRLVISPIVITLAAPRPAGVVVTRPAYAVGNAYSVQRNRWYQMDASGDCFEVSLLQTGQQVWTRVGHSLCR